MTVTAPFGSAESAAPQTQRIEQVDATPLRRDPIVPFIFLGMITLLAISAVGFLLSTPA